MRPSEAQETSAPATQIWSQILLSCDLICIGASFAALSGLLALEVWKKMFVMLTPHAP